MSDPTLCPRCHHVHLDYLDDEACVSCGCEGLAGDSDLPSSTAIALIKAVEHYGWNSPSLPFEFDRILDAAPSPALTREALAAALLKVTQEQPGLLAEADMENVERVDAAAWAIFEALGTPPPAPTSTREETP